MNPQSDALPESSEAQHVTPMSAANTRPMYWSVRRELWEYRSIYIAPLAAGGLFLLGFLISLMHLPTRMRGLASLDLEQQRKAIAQPYDMAAGLIMITTLIVGILYCLDALHGERRDRSILFWKSLPVSDVTTVLSKASIPFVVLPLVTFGVTVAVQFVMLVLSSVVLAGSGQSVAALWTQLSFGQMSGLLLYHLVTVHVLWHAPFYGWLLLISAWARRTPFLWAVLPVVAIAVVERIAFNTTHFANLLLHRLAGGVEAVTVPGSMPMNPMTHLTPERFLSAPGLWIGLGVTALFLGVAVRLRRYRAPM